MLFTTYGCSNQKALLFDFRRDIAAGVLARFDLTQLDQLPMQLGTTGGAVAAPRHFPLSWN